MTFKATFDPIGKRIHLGTDICNLSGRDKVALFQALMEDLGITERLSAEPDATLRAQEIITEQWEKHWGAA